MELIKKAKELQDLSKDQLMISLCSGTGCKAAGSDYIYDILKEEVKKVQPNIKKEIIIRRTGCHGFCEKGPLIIFYPQDICYLGATEEDIPLVVSETLKGNLIEKLLYKTDESKLVLKEFDIPFYKYQKRIILANNSKIDSKSIGDYILFGGYRALSKALKEMNPEEVLNEVKESGLRGRGGGGFPTGLKWDITRKAKGDPKYMIVNGDEGDPGAYMDRSILEGNPHSVLEGLIIGAYVVGASKGFIYIRQEYPLAIENMGIAITNAQKHGFIGNNILNSEFDFNVEIYQGAGAFVCGEETALIRSIEGKRGMPRPRPPFPANEGIYGKPTCINNVETYANIPHIILNGSKWFNGIGTDSSKGTKVFALTGAVNNTGLVEVPMGISLRDIIYKIGGGIKGNKKFKAIQLGGPSGGCIPEKYLDVEVDYEKVKEVGAMMGSGGMIVLDEDICMVDMARFFMDFIQDESCGQCVPCKIGTRRMLEILERITRGKGEQDDINKLEKLAKVVKETSLCGLGKTAPNPVISTLRYFRNEYEEHILTKKSCERLHIKAKVKKV
ncbi:MAG: NADH-quinone oxidoreductase subunit NuoF [Actinobacteria bacterium]|nr:NADH-quinone oxidoreductase subunit NuoF [Actinomycetota bacterium]